MANPPSHSADAGSDPAGQHVDGPGRILTAIDRWGLPALALLAVLSSVASLWWPHGWDAGIFTWVSDTILQGGLPYRDAFDVKGPFSFYAYALLQRIGGLGMGAVRAFDLACMGGAAVAAAGIVGRFEVRRAGLWTAVFLLLYHYASDFWNTTQPDGWIAACSIFGMAILLRQDIDRRPGLAAVAAMLLGVGLLQKPTYGVLLPLPGLAVLLLPSRPLRARLVLAAGLTIVALVPAGLGLAWFVANDALPWLLEGYLTFNLEVSRQLVGGVPRATVITAVRAIDSPPLVLAIPAAAVGALHLWARDRRAFALFLAWIGGAVLSMAVQRRWFPYHWFNLAWAMAPLAGIGFARALRAHPRDAATARAIAVTTLAMLTLWFVFPLQQRVREWAQYLTGALPDREAYVGQFAPTESGIILDDLALARWLEVNTAPDDKVFIWDSPLANALAQRRAPTRVGFFVPLTLADRNRRQAIPLGPIQLAMRAEFMHALDHDTRVVAVTRASLEGREEYLRKSVPELYPEFHRTLRERWVVVDSAREYLIFAPHDGGGAPPAGPGGH